MQLITPLTIASSVRPEIPKTRARSAPPHFSRQSLRSRVKTLRRPTFHRDAAELLLAEAFCTIFAQHSDTPSAEPMRDKFNMTRTGARQCSVRNAPRSFVVLCPTGGGIKV